MSKELYDNKFFQEEERVALHTATRYAILIKELINPKSVIDLGCATGIFLSELRKQGVEHILGVDGEWIDKKRLLVSQTEFFIADLTKAIPIDKHFDLAICLETAEHLEEQYADVLIDSLCKLSDIILFSAAIPRQLGTNHVNEQWQSYWAKKFIERMYIPVDVIRPKVWDDERILPCYAQNTMMYAKSNMLEKHPELKESTKNIILDIVHPWYFDFYSNPKTVPFKTAVKGIYHSSMRVFKNKILKSKSVFLKEYSSRNEEIL